MAFFAVLAYLPGVAETDLHDVQRWMRTCDVQTGAVAFPSDLGQWVDGASAIIVLARNADRLNLYWWEPHRLRSLVAAIADRRLGDGCLDFFTWPGEGDEPAVRLRRLIRRSAGVTNHDGPTLPEPALAGLGLIGRSTVFRSALSMVARLASYDVPVLLEGETGTGKELFARALHYLGPRRSRAFVPVNCGGLPDTLIENELFGHSAGAYTGASRSVGGLVAQAEGGTLFLDEIDGLSAKGQATLLRFTQDQFYRPLGDSGQRQGNVRIVAATNRSLRQCVAGGSFREDLFYRLNLGWVRLPALRERDDDIYLLVDNILSRLADRYGTGQRRFDAVSMDWIASQEWLGNVRQLENFVHREFLLSDEDLIHIDPRRSGISFQNTVPSETSPALFKKARAQVLSEFEARYVRSVLSASGGSVTEAARRAGKDRRVFGRLMKKYGIERAKTA